MTPSGVIHRWRPFPDHHLTVIDGIPVTRVARTLVDLAGVLHPGRTERAVDSCLGARMVSLQSLHTTFGELAGRGRAGIAVMRGILDERPSDYVAPESELEARFFALVRAAGLPEPVRQLDTGDGHGWIGRVDVTFAPQRVLVELDSRAHHDAKLDHESDAARDARLRAVGWRRIVRVGWIDVTVHPNDLIAGLRRYLAEPVTLRATYDPSCHQFDEERPTRARTS